jgi:hypothetical protein
MGRRKAKRPMGRPPSYRAEFCEVAARHYLEGATDLEVADALDIHVSTLYRWHHDHPEFREAAKVAKEAADTRVERSLYHRAVGYTYDAVKIMQDKGKPVIVPYREHVPPDPGAAFNWLKNRKPGEWREKIDHSVSGPNGGPIPTRIELVPLLPKADGGGT